ncbi:MAG: diguanylate cyclase [Actinomycetales bacterium]|nr:diguanylate cyclase [Actinomycetales bacterium]
MNARRQIPVLIGVQAAASLLSFAFIFAGSASDGMIPEHQALLGALWGLLAAFTFVGSRRLPWWYMDVTLTGSGLLLAVSATFTPAGAVQVMDSIGLMAFGVFAAYQLSAPRVAVFLIITTVAFVGATMYHPVVEYPFVIWLAMILFVANTVHVWFLVSRLGRAAVTDPLTGALNRKGLYERAPLARAVALRAKQPTAVVVLDLNAFKQFNDKYGHGAGDDLLAGLVEAWRGGLRPSDLLARVGGDEFALVLPNCSSEEAATTLQRLRALSGSGWTAGVVEWHRDEPLLTAVDAADHVMYQTKHPRG